MADQGKSLAGRAPENAIDGPVPDPSRLADQLGAQTLDTVRKDSSLGKIVLVNGAMHRIDLDGGGDVETGLLEAETEASCPGEKIDADWSHALFCPCRYGCCSISILAVRLADVDRLVRFIHKVS